MPANSDHTRRDAQHAARAEIAIQIQKYVRRLSEEAYAHIAKALSEYSDGPIDGTALGREAAQAAFSRYLGSGDVHEPVEALPAGAD